MGVENGVGEEARPPACICMNLSLEAGSAAATKPSYSITIWYRATVFNTVTVPANQRRENGMFGIFEFYEITLKNQVRV